MENIKHLNYYEGSFDFKSVLDFINVTAIMTEHHVEYTEEKDWDENRLKKIVICSKKPHVDSIIRSDGTYGRFILRFYEDENKNIVRMSLCDYITGILSTNIEDSMKILSENL